MKRIREILVSSRRVAVLGAHWERARAAFYVPDYLSAQGYEVFPVNPRGVGRELWGQPVVARLVDLEGIDLVDVFRRSDQLEQHVPDFLALGAPIVWFQLGIRNESVAAKLVAGGLEVIQDRCTLADHRAMGLGPHRSKEA